LRMEPVWMILGESAGVAAALAVDASIPVQDVPYEQLRPKLDELGQKLVRGADGKHSDQPRVWNSRKQWNAQKKGYEWLFPHIDKDSNGKISSEEYVNFQKFKSKNENWKEVLKKTEQ